MNEKLSIDTKILELSNSNHIYMTMNIRILSATVNANGAKFTEDFINGTVENKEDYIGIPLVVDRKVLESGNHQKLTHMNRNGELGTDQIGSFVDFWSETDEEGVLFLAGAIRIMKRFTKTCNAIIELYEGEQGLSTSCEVAITKYDEVSSNGERVIGYNNGDNKLFASCIVTSPADEFAKADVLVAEAHKADKENINNEPNHKPIRASELNSGKNRVVYHLDFNNLELSEETLHRQIATAIEETGKINHDDYYIYEIYPTYVMVTSFGREYEHPVLYKIGYQISENGKDVIIDSPDNWIKGSEKFVADSDDSEENHKEKGMDLMSKQDEKLLAEQAEKEKEAKAKAKKEEEEKAKEDKAKEEKAEEDKKKKDKESKEADDKSKKDKKDEDEPKDKDKEQAEEDEKKAKAKKEEDEKEEKEKKDKELSALAKELADTKNLLVAEMEKTKTLTSEVETLSDYKAKFEQAQKEEASKELSEKFARILSEDSFKSEEVQEAINELNESKLNSIAVEELASKVSETTSEKEDVTVLAEKTKTTLKDMEDIKGHLFSKVE